MIKRLFTSERRETCGKKIVRILAGLALMSTVGCSAHHTVKMDLATPPDTAPKSATSFDTVLDNTRQNANIIYVPVMEMNARVEEKILDSNNGDPRAIAIKETGKELRAFAKTSKLSPEKTKELMEIFEEYPEFFTRDIKTTYENFGPFQSSFGDGISLIVLPSALNPEGPLTKEEEKLFARVFDGWGLKTFQTKDFKKKLTTFLTLHETAHAEKAHNNTAWQHMMKEFNTSKFFNFLDTDNYKQEMLYQESYADIQATFGLWTVEKDPILIREIIYLRAINMLLEPDHGTTAPLLALAKNLKIMDNNFPEMTLEESLQAQQGLMKTIGKHLTRSEFKTLRNCNLEAIFIESAVQKIQGDQAQGKITDPHQKAYATLILTAAQNFGIIPTPAANIPTHKKTAPQGPQ